MKKFILTFTFCVTVSLCHGALPVLAQQTSLSLTPPVVEILISPNKQVTQTFNLSYLGPNLLLIPELHSITPKGNNGHVDIESKPLDPASIPLVIKSSKPLGEPIELTESGSLPLTLTFEAPTTDKAIDVYLALVLKTVSADDLRSASSTTPAISALILVSINPTGVSPIELNISQYELPVIHDSWHKLIVEPELENETPFMIRPEGKFVVLSPSGKSVQETTLFPNLILGDSSRAILGLDGQLSIPLTWEPSWNDIGPYRFRLTINTQGGSKLAESEKTIWILPIRALSIFILFTTMIGLNYYYFKKRKSLQN